MAASSEAAAPSPLARFRAHLERGELAYQFDPASARAVFYPRVLGPGSGNPELEWRVSAGLGTVHAVTVIAPRGEPPYNVVLVDMDALDACEGLPDDERRGLTALLGISRRTLERRCAESVVGALTAPRCAPGGASGIGEVGSTACGGWLRGRRPGRCATVDDRAARVARDRRRAPPPCMRLHSTSAPAPRISVQA